MKENTHDLLIHGGKPLAGTITTNTSKNGSVALLCAALINQNKTHVRGIADIEEVKRLIEVMEDLGVSVTRENDTVTIAPPTTYNLNGLFNKSFERIRSGLMLIPALAHKHTTFKLPAAGGCSMGKRTTIAHTHGLEKLGISIQREELCSVVSKTEPKTDTIVMYEMSDTATVNMLIAASLTPQTTTISFASANYQVQEICFFLQTLGVEVEGIGTSTLHVHGIGTIAKEVTYTNSEDPTESMAFIAIAATTNSPLTITRAPISFLELELLILESMGFSFTLSKAYTSENGKTKLVDITMRESNLTAPAEKIHALPYPGINTDNLPFFVPIATQAKGVTLIHDWMWENRAIYYTELNRLGANITLLDPHRVTIHGKTPLRGAQAVCPPALRPAMIILVAMLASEGTSILRDTYIIHRGYEDIVQRLNTLGADMSVLK